MRYTKKQMAASLTIGMAITFPLIKFYFGLTWLVSGILCGVLEIVVIFSFIFEKKADNKYKELAQKIRDGEYHSSHEWREEYLKFKEKGAFEPIRHRTMRSELSMHYLRPTGFFMAAIGIAVAVLGIFFHEDMVMLAVLILTGLGFILYGIFCIFPKNVRRFIKENASEIDSINDSFVNGKMLTFKKNIAHEYVNSGINFGSRYVVIFTVKSIFALDYREIASAVPRVQQTKLYGNGMYTGSIYTYFIDITANNGAKYSVMLDEMQAELAAETLRGILTSDSSVGLSRANKEFHA